MTRDEILKSFPDINLSFEGAKTLEDVCDKYIDILNGTKIYHNILYSNELLYFGEIKSKESRLREEYCFLQEVVENWNKKHHCSASIEIRIKSFIELNKKIRLFLLNGFDLDLIRDILGIRVILHTYQVDSLESIKLCYSLMNEVVNAFTIERKCLILDSEPRIGEGLSKDSSIAKSIYVPENTYLDSNFITKVKDYVFTPKASGYQSLHAYIKTPDSLTFALQIRTISMHILAKLYHPVHKTERYENVNLDLNFEKIKVNGVSFDSDYNLTRDDVGLIKGIDPFNLN